MYYILQVLRQKILVQALSSKSKLTCWSPVTLTVDQRSWIPTAMKYSFISKSSFCKWKISEPLFRYGENVQHFSSMAPRLPPSVFVQHVVKSTVLQSQIAPMTPLLEYDCRTQERIISKRSYMSKKNYTFCELKEEDLEEDFVRGSGPGGQSVNQTANCVVLKHRPSGIVVKCHETRSLVVNRQRARERLQEKLDFHLHGSNSFLALQEQESSLRRKEKKKRNKSRLELKKAFKEREGID